MIDKRIDAPFLQKFVRKTPFLNQNELIESIVNEIGNILSSRHQFPGRIKFPFAYGIQDLLSMDNSVESLNTFKENCRNAILKFEPRVSDVAITNCQSNHLHQSLNIELIITCQNFRFGHTFSLEY